MKKTFFLLLSTAILFSFSGKKDNPQQGLNLKEFEKSLALIPGGSYDSIPSDLLRSAKPITVDTFYIYTHEVSNKEYLEFVNDVKKKDTALFRQMLPDTLVWIERLTYCEPYMEYYFRHPAYSNYPVVGITYEQAEYYGKWLTEKYMKEDNRKFKNAEFKLPTIKQWTYAAMGRKANRIFPWDGIFMQNKKGEWMANFLVIPQNNINWTTFPVQTDNGKIENKKVRVATGGQVSGFLNNNVADITASVISYYPNDYGLYNMAGNVEEYVREKGITKGGSWKDTGYYLQNFVEERYDSTNYKSSERGFRFIMEIKK